MSIQSDIDEPDWSAILRGVQAQLQDRIHTSLPGVVKSYDITTQTATIQLAVQLQGHSVPPLDSVPVLQQGGAEGFVHVPLAAGDTVLVVFCEADFSKWLATGSVSAPAYLRRHGLNAIAIPGLRRPSAALSVTAGHVTVGATGAVHLGADNATQAVVLQTSPSTWQTVFDTWATSLTAVGPPTTPVTNATLQTFMQALSTALTSAGWPGNFNATKVKAK